MTIPCFRCKADFEHTQTPLHKRYGSEWVARKIRHYDFEKFEPNAAPGAFHREVPPQSIVMSLVCADCRGEWKKIAKAEQEKRNRLATERLKEESKKASARAHELQEEHERRYGGNQQCLIVPEGAINFYSPEKFSAHSAGVTWQWLRVMLLNIENGDLPAGVQAILPIDHGDLVLEWPKQLSAESLKDFHGWMRLIERAHYRWGESTFQPGGDWSDAKFMDEPPESSPRDKPKAIDDAKKNA